jgi:glycosyltransferase involved in cell wall biosynthesis
MSSLKILIINSYDLKGGAAIASYRLHKCLLENNINSMMLVLNKEGNDYTVLGGGNKFEIIFNKLRGILDYLPVRLFKGRTKTLFSPSWIPFGNIVKKIHELNPDIVHLHWICDGMLKIEDLKKINVPVIWSLHDMWPFTGGCHYNENCNLFVKDCSKCKVLGIDNCFLSKFGLKRKKNTYKKMKNLTFVPTSKWIESMAKKNFAEEYLSNVLYNPLDVHLFKPMQRESVRIFFNIPVYKKVILFGASNPFSDYRKGFVQLSNALDILQDKDVLLLIVGSSKPEISPFKGYEVRYIPYIKDEISLPLIYNVADVTIVPSLQETFGQMSSESLACAVPVVGFDATGTADIVDHKFNGYLAKNFEHEDLAEGISWVLNNKDYNTLCVNARNKALKEFDCKVLSQKYIDLYRSKV